MSAIEAITAESTTTKINNDYIIVNYNGIDLYMTSDKKWFNATKLLKAFRTIEHIDGKVIVKQSFSDWFNGSSIKSYFNRRQEMIKEVKGKGTQQYKGVYMSTTIFERVVGAMDFTKGSLWLDGEEWNTAGLEGYVYMVQPPSIVNSNTVKIGETLDLVKRFNNYKKGTQILAIAKVSNRSAAEKILKNYYDKKAINDKKLGAEYYEVESIEEAYELFNDALGDEDVLEGNINLYEQGAKIYNGKSDFSI